MVPKVKRFKVTQSFLLCLLGQAATNEGVRSVSKSNLLMLTERDSWAGIETDNYDFIIYPLTARAPHELQDV